MNSQHKNSDAEVVLHCSVCTFSLDVARRNTPAWLLRPGIFSQRCVFLVSVSTPWAPSPTAPGGHKQSEVAVAAAASLLPIGLE